MSVQSKIQRILLASTPLQLIYFVAGILFLEFCTMLFMDLLPPLPLLVTALIDCSILSIMLAPAFYFFVVRPQSKYLIAQKRSAEALKESKERLRTITSNAPVLIMEVDKNGRIVFISRDLPGFKMNIVTGKNLRDWTPPEYHEEMTKSLNQVFIDGSTQYFQSHSIGTNGEMHWFLNSLTPVKVADSIENAILIASDITKLVLSEQRRIDILKTAMDGFWVVDSQGCLLEVNDSYCQMSGYSKDELISMHIRDLEAGEESHEIPIHINKVIEQGEDRFETQHRRKDGSLFDVEISTLYRSAEKQFVSFIRDITDRKKFEKDLIYHAELIENISDAVISTDKEFTIKSWNRSAEIIYGWKEEEVIGKSVSEILKTSFSSNISREESIRELQAQSIWQDEVIQRRKNNKSVNILASVKLLTDKDGLIAGSVSVNRDVTEHRKAEAKLHESEGRYTSLFKGNQSVMLLINPNTGEIKDANPAACRYYGWSHSEICNKNIAEINTLSKEEIAEELQKAKEEKRNHFYFKHRLANGEIRDVESFSGPIIFSDSTLLYSMVYDITERMLTEEELRKNKENLRAIMDATKESIYVFDRNGTIVEANETAAMRLNKNLQDILSHPFSEFVPNEICSTREEQIKKVFNNGKPIKFEDQRFNFIFEHNLFPIFNSGKVDYVVSYSREITEARKMEDALKESEAKFRNLVNDMEVGVLLSGPQSEIILGNPKAVELLGITKEQLLGRTPYDAEWKAIHEDGSPYTRENHPATWVTATGEPARNVVMGVYQPLLGEHAWFLLNARPLLNKDGTVNQVVTTFIDITELKKAQRELRENEQRLNYHFDNSPLAVVEWDNNFIVTQWSIEAEHIFGWKKDEALGKRIDLLNIIFEEDIPIVNDTIKRLTSGSENIVVSTNRNVTKNGLVIECTWYNSVLLDKNGQMSSVMSLVQDITERKRAEKALKQLNEDLDNRVKERTAELLQSNMALLQAEEKYRTVADFTYDWEYWINTDGNYNYVSPSCERISGYKAEEFIQNPELTLQIIHPEDIKAFQSFQQKESFDEKCHYENQFRIIRRDGSIRWIEILRHSIYDESGKFIGIRGSKRDITERKKIEQLLKTSNRKYALLSENITEGIFICRNGYFEYVNRALCHIFGYNVRELIGMRLTQLALPQYAGELDFVYTLKAPLNQIRNIEIECFRKDGSIIFVEVLFNYVAKEEVFYGVVRDITESKQVQKNIVKAIILTEEKERTYFSKELHDGLGPLLSTIKLYLQWSERLKNEQSREEIMRKAEDVIEDALQAVKEISNKLSPHLLINYGLASAIQSFLNKLEETSPIHMELNCNITRRLGDEIEAAIYRAITECVNNTIKYSGAKNLTIRLIDDGELISIRYLDDGVGFDLAEALAIKKGLGLFNLQNRIQNIGGKISMFSEPGKGVDYQIIVNL